MGASWPGHPATFKYLVGEWSLQLTQYRQQILGENPPLFAEYLLPILREVLRPLSGHPATFKYLVGEWSLQLTQYRQQILGEQRGIFGEREVADAPHRLELRAGDFRGRRLGHLDRARVIVFSGQHEQTTAIGIDPADALARVPVAGVKRDITEENRRPTLPVMPGDLLLPFRRTLRRRQASDPFRNEQRLVHSRMGSPVRLPTRHLLAGLAGDDRRE